MLVYFFSTKAFAPFLLRSHNYYYIFEVDDTLAGTHTDTVLTGMRLVHF